MAEASVGDKMAEVSVGDKMAEVSVGDKMAEVSVGDKMAEVSVGDKMAEVSVGDKMAEVSVGDKMAEVSVGDKMAEVSVDDLKTKNKFVSVASGVLVLLVLVSLILTVSLFNQSSPMTAPICPIERYQTVDKRIDNYHWLRLSDEEKSAPIVGDHRQKVEDYLNAENEYLRSQMKHHENLTSKLFNEMKGRRMKKGVSSVPYKYNGWYYSDRYENDSDYLTYERRLGAVDGQLQQMLDGNKLKEGHEYMDIAELNVSPNNQIVGYSFDIVGRWRFIIRFRNLYTGDIYTDEVRNASNEFVWAKDSKSIFYIKKDDVTLRGHKVFKHILGTFQEEDKLIFEENDRRFIIILSKTKSEKYLAITSEQLPEMSEIKLLDLENEKAGLKIFQKRSRGHVYNIVHSGNKFYILTNLNGENFCLMSCPIENTNKENWKLEIPHRNETLLIGLEMFENFLVIEEKTKGLTNFHIIGKSANADYYIKFADQTYTAEIGDNPQLNSDVLRYEYSSLKMPLTIYDFDMNTKKKTLLKQEEVVGGFNSTEYAIERIMATVRDGTEVPISLVYKKDLKRNGLNPTLLFGYGAYGSQIEADFKYDIFSLLDRGFIYTIAHVRGSNTMGQSWHNEGRLLNKKNTFTDFNDCAHFLIDQNYTDPTKLMAMGASGGGLLIGAVINMEPQLYKGIFARVPFVDMMSTMLDESIPVTTLEYEEWGNPKVEKYYKYMLSYSPYDNIVAQNYPNILVTTGYHDSQVQYWEPAKWVAKLRALKTDNNKLLLLANMDFGHFGESGRFGDLKEKALGYAFFLDLVGITE